jgi:hypothetical protein
MEEAASTQRPRLSRPTRFILVLLPFLVVGIGLTVQLVWTAEKPSVVLPDGTRVVFERVSRGQPCSPPTPWEPGAPCYKHDEVRLNDWFTRQWSSLMKRTPDGLKSWLPPARHQVGGVYRYSQHPIRIILRYHGDYARNWETWLRDGNGFDFQPAEVQQAKLSGTSSGALAVAGYLSRRPHYHLVARPLAPDGFSSPLFVSRYAPVADLMVENPDPVTAPILKGNPTPVSVPLGDSTLVLERCLRRRGNSEANSPTIAGLTLMLSARRENRLEQFYDIPSEEFVLEDGAGNRVSGDPRDEFMLNSPSYRLVVEAGKDFEMPGRYMYLGRGEFLSDDPSLRLTVKAWRTAARPEAFAEHERFHFPSVPWRDRGPSDPPLSATVGGRTLRLSEVVVANSGHFAELRIAGDTQPGERLVVTEICDDQGGKLKYGRRASSSSYWPAYFYGGRAMELEVRHLAGTTSLSVTLAIVKPTTVQFVVTPELLE